MAYGPYSLLAGVFAVEINGKEHVATVAGILDGVGYFAAILSGEAFGRLLDRGRLSARVRLVWRYSPRIAARALSVPVRALDIMPSTSMERRRSSTESGDVKIELVVFDVAGTTVRDDDAVHDMPARRRSPTAAVRRHALPR